MRTSDLLAIGEAAILLRTTRQRILDLCARGLLPYVSVGPQRRVRRADVEALIETALTREQLEQLWLHQAIAIKFVANPFALLATAAANLSRLRALHVDGTGTEWLDRWQIVLDDGPGAVLDALTSPVDYAVRLRLMSPFAGVLSEVERRNVLDALAERRRVQVRSMRPQTRERVMRAV
ncbi:excisionase family DNA-binding protein [Actinoplanes sp. TBRC 11911]|uniref:helix-turn-helix domain-containing protein n=1 Tax=Actinoplanes sp. TBRC 11911 TaxID=2729386 RepID=UPI00145CAE71|nr:helix-turn-helix domain-containing protein [Actinoplanes sp. TBRC 11911]NMO56806.1 excisionase family DNA-binding protein [Actinoplanes sp. TBRC 11911]